MTASRGFEKLPLMRLTPEEIAALREATKPPKGRQPLQVDPDFGFDSYDILTDHGETMARRPPKGVEEYAAKIRGKRDYWKKWRKASWRLAPRGKKLELVTTKALDKIVTAAIGKLFVPNEVFDRIGHALAPHMHHIIDNAHQLLRIFHGG